MKRCLIIAAAAMFAVCCEKPAEGDGAGNGPTGPVQGPEQILALNSVIDSRLPQKSWNETDRINVLHSEAGQNRYVADGIFAFDGGGNKFAGTLQFIPEEAGLYDWRIVWPGSSDAPDAVSVEIGSNALTQASLESAAHLTGEGYPLYGYAKASAAGPDLPLKISVTPLYSVIEFNVKNVTNGPVTMLSAVLTSSDKICGAFTVDVTGEDFEFIPAADASSAITVSLSSAQTLRAGRSAKFYFAVCPFTAAAGTLQFDVNGEKFICPDAVEFAPGEVVSIEMEYDKAEVDPDALTGVYTVSASGKKVAFSRGNLWYGHDASNREFKIETVQNKALNPESDWDGVVFNGKYIQHFIWSDDRYVAYNILAPDVTFETTDRLFAADGGAVEGWTVLTKDEWNYLLNERTVNGGKGAGYSYFNSGLKNAGYKADGTAIKGLFIFPDDYKGTPAVIGNKALTWDEINAAGIAYLPAGGNYSKRAATSDNGWVNTADFGGAYLGADIFANDSNVNTFCTVKFNQNSESVTINTAPNAKFGYTIRLVKEIN